MLLTRNDLHIVKLLAESFFCKFMDMQKKSLWTKLQARFLQKENKTNILQYELNELV